jgi:hypothetical protein
MASPAQNVLDMMAKVGRHTPEGLEAPSDLVARYLNMRPADGEREVRKLADAGARIQLGENGSIKLLKN